MKKVLIVLVLVLSLNADWRETYPDMPIDISVDAGVDTVASGMNFDLITNDKSFTIGSGFTVINYSKDVSDEYADVQNRPADHYNMRWDVINITYKQENGLFVRMSPMNFAILDIDDGISPSLKVGWGMKTEELSMTIYLGVEASEYRPVFGGIQFNF